MLLCERKHLMHGRLVHGKSNMATRPTYVGGWPTLSSGMDRGREPGTDPQSARKRTGIARQWTGTVQFVREGAHVGGAGMTLRAVPQPFQGHC